MEHWEFHIIAAVTEWILAAMFVVVLLSLVPGVLAVVVLVLWCCPLVFTSFCLLPCSLLFLPLRFVDLFIFPSYVASFSVYIY